MSEILVYCAYGDPDQAPVTDWENKKKLTAAIFLYWVDGPSGFPYACGNYG